jgi:flagellar biogenesis protein FliO
MIWAASKMILGLGIVFVLLFFLMRVLKRTHLVRGELSLESGIRLLATKPIAPHKYISLVEIGGEILALGISESQITLLTKIENKEFLEKMAAQRSIPTEPLSLLQQISKGSRWMKGGSLRISHGK